MPSARQHAIAILPIGATHLGCPVNGTNWSPANFTGSPFLGHTHLRMIVGEQLVIKWCGSFWQPPFMAHKLTVTSRGFSNLLSAPPPQFHLSRLPKKGKMAHHIWRSPVVETPLPFHFHSTGMIHFQTGIHRSPRPGGDPPGKRWTRRKTRREGSCAQNLVDVGRGAKNQF